MTRTQKLRLRWCLTLLLLSSLAAAQRDFTLLGGSVTYHGSTQSEAWQGEAPLQSLTLTPTSAGLELSATVETGAFASGNFIRDANARVAVFEAGAFPTATLRGTLPLRGELQALEASETSFSGELNLHGVTQPLSFPVRLTRSGDTLAASARFPLSLSAYNMKRPSLFGVFVDDEVEVVLSVSVALGESAASP